MIRRTRYGNRPAGRKKTVSRPTTSASGQHRWPTPRKILRFWGSSAPGITRAPGTGHEGQTDHVDHPVQKAPEDDATLPWGQLERQSSADGVAPH